MWFEQRRSQAPYHWANGSKLEIRVERGRRSTTGLKKPARDC